MKFTENFHLVMVARLALSNYLKKMDLLIIHSCYLCILNTEMVNTSLKIEYFKLGDIYFNIYMLYNRDNVQSALKRPTRHSRKFHGRRWYSGRRNVRSCVPVRLCHRMRS